MKQDVKFDFSGYATKAGLKCSDGRTILPDAFKHNDGQTVPLVWQHMHSEPTNILGHAVLENRQDGVYAYCKFNGTETGQNAKVLVEHGDITAMSIYANQLKEQAKQVIHGVIREVSLVLAGANPEALIDNVCIIHADGSPTGERDSTEAIIYTGGPVTSGDSLDHADDEEDSGDDTSDGEETVQEIFDSMTDKQKTVVYAMLGSVESALTEEEPPPAEHSNNDDEEDETVKHNAFDEASKEKDKEGTAVLSHDQELQYFNKAMKSGSLKDGVLAHAAEFGIDNIEVLFPEAQLVRPTPDIVGRDRTWVRGVMNGVSKSPFSRVRSMYADLTEDAARAKGYVTGSEKFDEVFPVATRYTTPTTVYKKQKLNRDDVTDITGFDVVAWIRAEMREALDEELARAFLIGDGRGASDPDHINPLNVRPIWTDDDFYAYKFLVDPVGVNPEPGPDSKILRLIDDVVRMRKYYKGSGNPTFYTTVDIVSDMLLVRDKLGRRIFTTMAELISGLRVADVVEVEVMENQTRTVGTETRELLGILVNLKDYTVGADRGGQIATFDDFDIDFNQQKYLIETRLSGALTKWQSAVVLETIPDEEADG